MIPLVLAGIGLLFIAANPFLTVVFAAVASLFILSEPEDHKA